MRWLLRKDLLILARSRLLVALLVLYPVVIALLIGFALSRGPSRQPIAIVDETPPGATVQVGGERVDVDRFAEELFTQVKATRAPSRSDAIAKVKSGAAVAAVVIPRDLAARLGAGLTQAHLEVLYNGDALEQSLVSSAINSAVARANIAFSEEIQKAAATAIQALLQGRNAGIGAPPNLIGLEQVPPTLRRLVPLLPTPADRRALERVEVFARFAARNLSVSRNALATISQPIKVDAKLLHGRRTPLDAFAVVVAVSVSLMFLAVLLAAGGIALEREERALSRLLRGPVSRVQLLAEKGTLAAACAFVVAFAMLAGVGAFVTLDWGRVGLWLLALAVGAVAFGALGVAIGVLAREVRAASLLAFLLALPLAFLALVPAGAVAHGFYDAIGVISFAFPFKACLQALDAAVNRSAPALGGSLAHLAGLTLAFGALAHVGLRRAD
jgi:ABC-type Na+ efflux pump permease subunit